MSAHDDKKGWLPAGWPEAWRGTLDDAALVQAGSATILARARDYVRAIDIVEEDPLPEPALRGFVRGSELYEIEVWIEDDGIAGHCSCPHADEGWFCKHQSALALRWRQRLAQPASPNTPSRTPSLAEFLHAQDAATLADKLLELAGRDVDLSRTLHQWKQIATQPDDTEVLAEVVHELLEPDSHLDDMRHTLDYGERARGALPLLAQVSDVDALAGFELAADALHHAWDALAQADNSEGEIGTLCEELGEALVRAVGALCEVDPVPLSVADDYVRLLADDPLGSFSCAAVERQLPQPVLERVRDLLTPAAPGTVADRRAATESWRLQRLQDHRLRIMKTLGQGDEVLALLRAALGDECSHDTLIRALLDLGQPEAAAQQAAASLQVHPDGWTLQHSALRAFQAAARHADVLALQRRRFERLASVAHYREVMAAAPAAGVATGALRAELLAQLVQREQAEQARARQFALRTPPHLGTGRCDPGDGPDVSARAAILASESQWDEALACVQPPARCETGVLLTIAKALDAPRHDAAVALLLRVFRLEMRAAKSPYTQALALVREITARQAEPARRDWLASIRTEFKAKRNFIAALPAR